MQNMHFDRMNTWFGIILAASWLKEIIVYKKSLFYSNFWPVLKDFVIID